jgi:RNA polymerase sigma-70 factor, ECF subfamily
VHAGAASIALPANPPRPVTVRPDPRTRADRRLVAGLRRGDPDTLAEIHRTYAGLVFGYLRRALPDAGAAEDVHQEVFLEVWRRGPSYDPGRSSLGTWIMLIARSRAIDHLRRRTPEPRDPHSGMPESEDAAASPELLVERWAMALMVARLPDEEARVLRMRFHDGLSQTEIAERTGIALGTVKTYMVRGLRRLREQMEADG